MIARRERAVTGSHVLIVLSAFFSVIIVANLVLAVIADRSWTGLVVPDSYVESQRINDRLAASRNQAQLGWQGSLFLDGRIWDLIWSMPTARRFRLLRLASRSIGRSARPMISAQSR